MLVMRLVEVIVESQPPYRREDPQIPGAVEHIALAPGVINVLQRRPVHGEEPVRQQPAPQMEIERPPESGLETESARDLRPYAERWQLGDIAHVRAESHLRRDTLHEEA